MGFKPDFDDQLVYFDTVGLVIWPVKVVPEMTYNVLSWTLSLLCTTTTTAAAAAAAATTTTEATEL